MFLLTILLLALGFNYAELAGNETTWIVDLPGGFKAEGRLLSNRIDLPNPIEIKLYLSFPENYEIDSAALEAALLQNLGPSPVPFHLLEATKENSFSDNGLQQIFWHFVLEPQLPGHWPLTFMAITFTPQPKSEGPVVRMPSGIFRVTVSLPAQEEKQIWLPAASMRLETQIPLEVDPSIRQQLLQQQITKAPLENRRRANARQFPWGALTLFILLGTFFLYFKCRPPKAPLKRQQAELHYAYAQSLLQNLQAEPEIRPEKARAFVVALSEALKAKLGERFGLPTQTLTTEEFFMTASKLDIKLPQAEQLGEFCRSADRIKFANEKPTLEECVAIDKSVTSLWAEIEQI